MHGGKIESHHSAVNEELLAADKALRKSAAADGFDSGHNSTPMDVSAAGPRLARTGRVLYAHLMSMLGRHPAAANCLALASATPRSSRDQAKNLSRNVALIS